MEFLLQASLLIYYRLWSMHTLQLAYPKVYTFFMKSTYYCYTILLTPQSSTIFFVLCNHMTCDYDKCIIIIFLTLSFNKENKNKINRVYIIVILV